MQVARSVAKPTNQVTGFYRTRAGFRLGALVQTQPPGSFLRNYHRAANNFTDSRDEITVS